MGNVQALEIQIPHEIVQYWGWFLAFGIGLVALGVAAVARSITATVASMLFFGWLLVIACGIEIAQAVMVGHWAGFFHHLLARDPLRGNGPVACDEAGDQRRGRDLLHGHVLHDRRAVSADRLVRCYSPGLGLAGAGRGHHASSRPAGSRAMACLGALGDRSFPRDRPDFLGCAWIALALGLRSS